MKIVKLVKFAAGGLAVLALSVNLTQGTVATFGPSLDVSASSQFSQSTDDIDWP